MLLSNIALFLQIVEKGSLAAAGREAGLSSTTVSERLAALEAHYRVVLLNRTTRAISLTDEGRTLVEGAKLVLGEAEDLETRIRLGAQTLSGPIRISAPSDIGRTVVAAEVSRFVSEHPAISIELLLSDGYVDVVREGFEIALRFGPVTEGITEEIVDHITEAAEGPITAPKGRGGSRSNEQGSDGSSLEGLVYCLISVQFWDVLVCSCC